MVLLLEQFFGGTNDHGLVALSPTDVFDDRTCCGIRKVFTVPRQQKLDAICHGNGDMKGIFGCFFGERTSFEQRLGKAESLFGYCEELDHFEDIKTRSGRLRISSTCLLDNMACLEWYAYFPGQTGL
jgi:hypothetical protein